MARHLDSALLLLAFLTLLVFGITDGFAGVSLLLSGACVGWFMALRWADTRHGE